MQLTYIILSGLSLLNIGVQGITMAKALTPPHSSEAYQARSIVHRRQFHNVEFRLEPEDEHVRQATRHSVRTLSIHSPGPDSISTNGCQDSPSSPTDDHKNIVSGPDDISLDNHTPSSLPQYSDNSLDTVSRVADSTVKDKGSPTTDVNQGPDGITASNPASASLFLNPAGAEKSMTDNSVSKLQKGQTVSEPLAQVNDLSAQGDDDTQSSLPLDLTFLRRPTH